MNYTIIRSGVCFAVYVHLTKDVNKHTDFILNEYSLTAAQKAVLDHVNLIKNTPRMLTGSVEDLKRDLENNEEIPF